MFYDIFIYFMLITISAGLVLLASNQTQKFTIQSPLTFTPLNYNYLHFNSLTP